MDWLNKRVMITGGDGFIGLALSLKLMDLGADVYTYDLKRGQDVCDYNRLLEFIQTHEIELVYHLAAQPHVPVATRHPHQTLRTNIDGTLNVLEICANLKVPCIIASSDKAYGEAETGYTKDSPLNAKHAYDLSKACADSIAQFYQRQGANVKIMRLCNVYGPGDVNHNRLVPYLIRTYLQGGTPELRGNPSMQREWLFVGDAVAWYIRAADLPGTAFPVGGFCGSVGEIVERIRAKIGGPAPIVLNTAKGEIQYQRFAPSELCGTTPLDDGITQTIQWWKEERL